jgi:signal transduction histidine kinase
VNDTPAPTSLEEMLRNVPLFADLMPADLEELLGSSRTFTAPTGMQVIAEGAAGEALFVILSGELEVTKSENGREIVLARRGAGDFLGEMSLLEQRPRTASVHAVAESRLLEIDAATFQHLLETKPRIATTILRTVAARLRSTESSLMAREKLASLGTLAAGLAHELNNPSAAIQRSAAYLGDVLVGLGKRGAQFNALVLGPLERQRLDGLLRGLSEDTPSSSAGTPAEEDRILERLEALDVEDPWDLAAAFAAFAWTGETVGRLANGFEEAHRKAVMGWIGAQLAARQMVDEIQRSAQAVSNIVKAVKSYAYLDQAAVQNVDLTASLEDTLMILKHKLRDGITVVRDYAPDLPKIEGFGSELNQVWTNLIDNAVDAMAGRGTIEVHAMTLGDKVEVRIANDGPPIPREVADRIFDPFFTTKPQGVGTGLGLHIVHNIVVNHHGGTIALTSDPGRTEFRIGLPLRLPEARK